MVRSSIVPAPVIPASVIPASVVLPNKIASSMVAAGGISPSTARSTNYCAAGASTDPLGSPTSKRSGFARNCERGVAFIEFAIVLPLLVIFLMFCFELGRLFYHYTILSQIAYEGARLGIQIEGMRPGCFDDNRFRNLGWQTSQNAPGGDLGPHYLAQARLVKLIRNYMETNYLTITGPDANSRFPAEIRSQHIRRLDAPDSDSYVFPGGACMPVREEANTFGVRISATYEPLFFPFVRVPLTAQSIGAFLYNNNQFFMRSQTINSGTQFPVDWSI